MGVNTAKVTSAQGYDVYMASVAPSGNTCTFNADYKGSRNVYTARYWSFVKLKGLPITSSTTDTFLPGSTNQISVGAGKDSVVLDYGDGWGIGLVASHYGKQPDDRVSVSVYYWHGDEKKWAYAWSYGANTSTQYAENFPATMLLAYDTNNSKPNRGWIGMAYPKGGGSWGYFPMGAQQYGAWRVAVSTQDNPPPYIPPKFPGDDNDKDDPGGDGEGPEGLEDDPIEIPEDPSISASGAGMFTLYSPTMAQIQSFGSYLWSDAFSLDTFKKLFADPMQAVIGLSMVPVKVPISGTSSITIGSSNSGVSANTAARQFVTVDCGTINIKPIWNTALDFEPYTKFSIFLPFIGTRELKTDDIMGKDLNIKYLVDILSGACTAHIKVGGSVLYQFSGSCATPIPVTAQNWNSLLTSCLQLAGAGIASAVTGGAAAPLAAGAVASMTAGAVANSKPNIQRTGAVSGAAGMLGVRVPYLIRETPRQSLAKDYNKFVGYPSNITSKLSGLKGYTQIENVHLEGIPATGDELSEIESLLKEGVIL